MIVELMLKGMLLPSVLTTLHWMTKSATGMSGKLIENSYNLPHVSGSGSGGCESCNCDPNRLDPET